MFLDAFKSGSKLILKSNHNIVNRWDFDFLTNSLKFFVSLKTVFPKIKTALIKKIVMEQIDDQKLIQIRSKF
jgi:hypothetical protein